MFLVSVYLSVSALLALFYSNHLSQLISSVCMFVMQYNYSIQVIWWRAVASIAWAVLLLPPITAVFVILSRFSLFHPIQTVSGQSLCLLWGPAHRFLKLWHLVYTAFLPAECLSLLTSASAIFSIILLCGVILMVGFLNLEYYTGEWYDTCFHH